MANHKSFAHRAWSVIAQAASVSICPFALLIPVVMLAAEVQANDWYFDAEELHEYIEAGRCNLKDQKFASKWPPGSNAPDRAIIALEEIDGKSAFELAGDLNDIRCLWAMVGFTGPQYAHFALASIHWGRVKEDKAKAALSAVANASPAPSVPVAPAPAPLPPSEGAPVTPKWNIDGEDVIKVTKLNDGKFVIALDTRAVQGMTASIVIVMVDLNTTNDVIRPTEKMLFTPANDFKEQYTIVLKSTNTEYKQSHYAFQAVQGTAKSKMYSGGSVLPMQSNPTEGAGGAAGEGATASNGFDWVVTSDGNTLSVEVRTAGDGAVTFDLRSISGDVHTEVVPSELSFAAEETGKKTAKVFAKSGNEFREQIWVYPDNKYQGPERRSVSVDAIFKPAPESPPTPPVAAKSYSYRKASGFHVASFPDTVQIHSSITKLEGFDSWVFDSSVIFTCRNGEQCDWFILTCSYGWGSSTGRVQYETEKSGTHHWLQIFKDSGQWVGTNWNAADRTGSLSENITTGGLEPLEGCRTFSNGAFTTTITTLPLNKDTPGGSAALPDNDDLTYGAVRQ